MNYKAFIIVLCSFILGVISTLAFSYYTPSDNPSVTTTYVIANTESVKEDADSSFVTRILGMGSEEKPSPYNWISEGNIRVEKDRVTIDIQDAQWSRFTDTNSMDPVIDYGTNAIQIVPETEEDVHVGDIVSYNSKYAEGTIIHRVIETGYDSDGWYALMKGDNNNRQDPGKIRFSQIKRVVVAIIY